MKTKFIIPTILLLVAMAPLPYGFYYLLKFAVCIAIVMEINELQNTKQKNSNDVIMLGALLVLYNPIVAIPLGKAIWTIVNIATIVYFVYYSQKNSL